MRVLAAFDKFKGSMSAPTACDLAAGALASLPGWAADPCPLTDGGEGFAEILTRAAGGTESLLAVTGPRGAEVLAGLGYVSMDQIPKGARERLGTARLGPVAIAGMASASGLALLDPGMRDPLRASSVGTGQLIRSAAEAGAGTVLLGVGGSATHDLGLGALGALGLTFLAESGEPIDPITPADWPRVARIGGRIAEPLPPILIACDVDNPLLGARGALAVYGPQKGLRPEDADELEAGSAGMAALLCRHFGLPGSIAAAPGAGAAGGIAFGLMAAAGARLLPGFDLVASWIDLGPRMAAADIVVTGEGRFDDTSMSGKGPGEVVRRALALAKEVHVFAGSIALSRPIPGLFTHAIAPEGMSLDAAIAAAPALLFGALRREFAGR